MKRKPAYFKRNKKYLARSKEIESRAKKSFTAPKSGAKRKYVFFDEKSKEYFCDRVGPYGKNHKDRAGRPFSTSKRLIDATRFSKNSFGINRIIPRMKEGAWRIVRIE